MTAIRAVTFDCWGTLINDRDMSAALEARVQAVVAAGGWRLGAEAARELCDRAFRAHHDAWVSGEQFGSPGMARLCCAELGLDDDAADDLAVQFEDASLLGEVGPLDGAREALGVLRAAGIRTALVCDTGFTPGRVVRTFLDRHGLLELLEFCAFSNEVGVPKPNALIFRTALDAIGTNAREAVHVGDLIRTDVAGAKAIGMRAVRITAVNDSGTPEALPGVRAHGVPAEAVEGPDADAVIASYAELAGALRTLGAAL